jgi:hypothetical protein
MRDHESRNATRADHEVELVMLHYNHITVSDWLVLAFIQLRSNLLLSH